MIDRRVFIVGGVAAPLAAEAPQSGGATKRLGILSIASPSTPVEMAKSPFGTRLRELGWVEGNNLLVDLPIEQPTKFELVASLRTATALGLTKSCTGHPMATTPGSRTCRAS